METSTKSNDRPKIIMLGAALLVAVVFISMTLISSNKEEKVAAAEVDDVSLMLPQATVNSGAMLLWSVSRPAGRNPFQAGVPGAIGAVAPQAGVVNLEVAVTAKEPAEITAPAKPKLTKTILLKGVVLNLSNNGFAPLAFLEIDGVTTTHNVGRRIMTGVVLRNVSLDGVVLDVFGEQEFLGVNQSIGPRRG